MNGDVNFTGSLYKNGVAYSSGGSSSWTDGALLTLNTGVGADGTNSKLPRSIGFPC